MKPRHGHTLLACLQSDSAEQPTSSRELKRCKTNWTRFSAPVTDGSLQENQPTPGRRLTCRPGELARQAPCPLYHGRFLQTLTIPCAPVRRHPEKHRAVGISAGTASGPPFGAWRFVLGFEADGGKMPKCPVSSQTAHKSCHPAFSAGKRRTACQIGSAHRHHAEGAIPYAEYLRIICVDRKRALDLSIGPTNGATLL